MIFDATVFQAGKILAVPAAYIQEPCERVNNVDSMILDKRRHNFKQ